MPLFSYKAVRANGEVEEGELEAADEATLVRQLQQDGLMPIRTGRAGSGLKGLFKSRKPKVDQEQVLHFTRELATLLEAGMTLDRALQILAELSDDEALVRMMENVREKVQGGDTLSSALEAQGKIFTPLYISMIKAGEAGGVLHNVLDRLADYLERSQELRESVRSALTYPTILLTVAGLSVIGLLVGVVPQFSQMFADMGKALPLPTQIVVNIGNVLTHYWWAILAAGFLGGAFASRHFARPEVKSRWDKRLLQWPLLGDLIAKVETARFTRTLGILLHNGLPLLMALNLVKDVINNTVIAETIEEAADSLKRGKGLADPLIEKGVLPPLALQMIKVGEESGDLEPMLNKVADVFDREVRASVKRLLTLLEPALIVGLGLIVAGIIVSIMLAILGANDLAI
ncbi:MAG TPA: type II secretion system F family protein [Chromatiaceae bacterium]|nr:type II secretion system F family protein [Chromatiaceae bacterium]